MLPVLLSVLKYVAIAAGVVAAVILLRKLYYAVRRHQLSLLSYSRAFSEDGAFEGDSVILTEKVHNGSFLPLFFLDMESFIYEDLRIEGFDAPPENSMQHCVSRFHLMPFMQIERTHKIRCRKRGYYTLESARVFVKDEYLFFESPLELYVYPKVIGMEDEPAPMTLIQGGVISKRHLIPDPFSLSGVRDYRSGDPFNLINFKQTAKSHVLMVNNRDFCSSRIYMIYVNFETGDDSVYLTSAEYGLMIEQALSYSAALIQDAVEFGYKVGFSANCVMTDGRTMLRFPLSSGNDCYLEVLREMAKIRAKSGISFSALLAKDTAELMTETEIFIFTAETSESVLTEIQRLEKLGNTVKVISLTPEREDAEVAV